MTVPRAAVSALILAGGKATRLGGVAKHELVINGEAIFVRQLRLLVPRVHEVLVAGPHEVAGCRRVRDRVEGAGPLAGIAAGLAAATSPWVLVVAGDMPDLTAELLDRMLGAAGDEVDAVGVRVGQLAEPLVCVLHSRVRPVLDRRLASGRFKASGLLADEGLVVAWLDHADPSALRNVNSPADVLD